MLVHFMSDHPFCLAPWVNSYRGTDGFRSLCCISSDRSADYPVFADWWNGPEIRAARRTLLAGGVPAQCQACVQSNRAGGQGYNESFNRRYAAQWAQIVAATDADGATGFRPLALDYRTSHCNLRCRTCDARNSSSIRAEALRHGDDLPPRAARADAQWWLDDGVLETVQQVYWAGGEPLMSPLHGRVMRRLLDTGRAGEVDVHYTSNLMHLDEHLLRDLAEYSQRFRHVAIGASIDGVGAIGEYIRTGWQHGQFMQHLAQIRARAPAVDLYWDCTLTNLGLLGLPQLLHEAAAAGMRVQCKLMEVNGVNDFLHVDLLQPAVVNDALQRCGRVPLPAALRRVVRDVARLLAQRSRPRVMTTELAALLARSEQRRGMVGFFMARMAPLVNGAGAPASPAPRPVHPPSC
jgi:hypothetical protein